MVSAPNHPNYPKKTFARAAHFPSNQPKTTFFFLPFCIFLCRCFARLQSETSRNFLVTRFMGKMLYVCIPVHFFFAAAHFHPGGS